MKKKIAVLLNLFMFGIVLLFVDSFSVNATFEDSISLNNYSGYFKNDLRRDSYFEVLTPNGTSVIVSKRDKELSSERIKEIDNEVENKYPEVIKLRNATKKYNCHSYAWYSTSENNVYWMDDPTAYYTDFSYDEVTTPRSGDIICYFDDYGSPSYFYDDNNLHSGIVISYNPSIESNNICGIANKVVVESKWGEYGLYRHNGDCCPYVSTYNGRADYVKFYRRHTHSFSNHYCSICNKYTETHDYHSPYTWINDTEHKATCGCGKTTNQGHAISSGAFNSGSKYATCLLCGGKATIGFTQFNILLNDYRYITENGSFVLPNGIIVVDEKDIEKYINNPTSFYELI